ncbi:LysR family transcriptional regulator [Maricurvus nonylphenolicus]|uniref:LysR family transcriptional regulator n=1 Tax=Maricurvus nonylphenolicus TaxID=1008307 RepID=UPI0036F3A1A8
MDRLTAMSMFVRVAENGSFSAVAKELETTQPTVSKNIAELESWLGVKLLNRSTRSLHLTEAGADYYERCVSILMDIEEAEHNAGSLHSQPRGTVRITTPAALGELFIVPCLKGFFEKYPDIHVDVNLNDRSLDLIQEGIDLGIRMGELSDSSLIAKQLAISPMVTVASPEYLSERGVPQHPRDLKDHNYIVYSGRGQAHDIEFVDGDVSIKVNVKGNLITNSSDAIRQALLSGHGVSRAPTWLVGDALADGRLKTVLDEFNLGPMPLSAVYPSGRHLPSKARCLLDYLAEVFSTNKLITG